jgi:hypothetical protein
MFVTSAFKFIDWNFGNVYMHWSWQNVIQVVSSILEGRFCVTAGIFCKEDENKA